MAKQLSVLLMGVLISVAIFGCSDEATEPTSLTQTNASGMVRGEINPDDVAFEYVVRPNDADPLVGPFVLRGSNIDYVDSLSVLSVDLTIENDGEVSHPLPIGLTFVSFLPGEVTVENPDNDENGPGGAIVFEFENDDLEWTPGEKSLPRQTLFGVDEGISVGFVAHVDIPQDTTTGSIGGVVWNDLDEDGEIDEDEPGVGGETVFLYVSDEPEVEPANDDYQMRTETAPDGSYRFDGLEAGFYLVARDVAETDCFPTTPTTINVVLVEQEGVVSDFLLANFGCVVEDVPEPPTIDEGDFVKVNGEFVQNGEDRLMARSIEVVDCDTMPDPEVSLQQSAWRGELPDDCDDWDDDWDDGDCDDDDHDWDDCHKYACWGVKSVLRGPVTGIDRENCDIEIMGSWVHIVRCDSVPNDTIPDPQLIAAGGDDRDHHPWLDLDDVEIGDRVWVRVMRKNDDDTLYGFWLREWNGTPDMVFGKVEYVSPPSGPLSAIRVLGVTVVITEDTDICHCD